MSLRVVLVAVCLVMLSACSSVEGDIKEFVICSLGARNSGNFEAVKVIDRKLDEYMRENNVNMSSREMMYLSDEIRQEVGMFNLGPVTEVHVYAAVKIFNSGYCQDIHEMGEIEDMPLMYYFMYPFL